MKILVLGINYAPELTGVGKYTSEFCEWLAEQGHEVRVISAAPYYPAWRIQPPYRNRYATEQLNRVTVIRCPIWVPRRPSGVKRLLHLASYAASALPAALMQIRWKPDVTLAIAPALACAPIALMVAKLTGACSWLHIQDFELDAAFELGLLRGRLREAANWAERQLLRSFDKVSSISGAMVERLVSKGVQRSSVVLFPNWVDTAYFTRGRDERSSFFGPQDEGRRIVLYSGNMGEKQGLEAVIEAAAELESSRPDILFVLCGDGAARTRLVAAAQERKLSNITFLPLQPAEAMPSFLASADLHLVVQKRGAADLVMPSKLVGILASGGAALVTAEAGTELFRVVAENGVGHVIPPENASGLAQAVSTLLSEKVDLNAMRIRAKEYASRHLDRSAVLTAAFEAAVGLPALKNTEAIPNISAPEAIRASRQ